MNKNKMINWFVIPVKIFDRAHNFYKVALDQQLPILVDHKWNDMAIFWDIEKNLICGCISSSTSYEVSNKWVIIYLNTFWKIDEIINRVIPAGGKIKMPKTKIGNYGYIAHFEDTEGNIIGVHQDK